MPGLKQVGNSAYYCYQCDQTFYGPLASSHLCTADAEQNIVWAHAEKYLRNYTGLDSLVVNGHNVLEVMARFALEYNRALEREVREYRERIRTFDSVPRMSMVLGRRYREEKTS